MKRSVVKINSRAATPPGQSGKNRASFPIAGIGASAGGLEAFSELLRHLPLKTGMAFVLIQHLDPKHSSDLREILSRTTSIPGGQATQRDNKTPGGDQADSGRFRSGGEIGHNERSNACLETSAAEVEQDGILIERGKVVGSRQRVVAPDSI